MKMHAYVAGIGMTRFGNHLTVKLKDLAAEAIPVPPFKNVPVSPATFRPPTWATPRPA